VDARAQEKRFLWEISEAVTRLCPVFPGEHRRKLDREQYDTAEFVDKLTHQGCLAPSIPEKLGSYRAAAAGTNLFRGHVGTRGLGPARST
jgi:alkylation response protein AidB-like acyl-CoA dehydrogenase